MSTLDALLRRERAVVAAGLATLTALAWIYLSLGAGMGMSALDMTRLTLFPHLQAQPATSGALAMPGMPGRPGTPATPETSETPRKHGMHGMPGMAGMTAPSTGPAEWATVAAMWWVMMIAMMTPSAAPLVLLYGRVLSHHGLRESGRGAAFSVASAADATRAPAAATAGLTARGASSYAPSAVLMIGYLLAWLAFSLVAATLQLSLQRAGLVSVSLLSSRSAVLSASVLLAAGVYQLSPLKHACLRHCRGPVEFLTRHWRPGIRGALSMGARHGAWCVGCCWMLMALLFVGGVMNLAWVALLAVLVLAEKVAPAGPAVGRAVGAVLIVWGIATLVV